MRCNKQQSGISFNHCNAGINLHTKRS